MSNPFTKVILEGLKGNNRMTTKELYSYAKTKYPDLCKDGEPCIHKGRYYGQPEWMHQLRNAQQVLKRKGDIGLSSGSWQLIVTHAP
jgi:hypothetical protein